MRSWVSGHLTFPAAGGPTVDISAIITSTSSPPLEDEGAKAQGEAAAGDHPRGEEAAQLCSQPTGRPPAWVGGSPAALPAPRCWCQHPLHGAIQH